LINDYLNKNIYKFYEPTFTSSENSNSAKGINNSSIYDSALVLWFR